MPTKARAKVDPLRAKATKHGRKVVIDDLGEGVHDAWGSIYADEMPHFCMLRVRNTAKGLKAEKFTDEHRCREELARDIMSWEPHLRPKLASFMIRNKEKKVEDKEFVDNILNGVQVINYFERTVGWSQTLALRTQRKDCAAIIGPSYWSDSPLNISLYLLIVRLIAVYPLKKRESAPAYLKRISKNAVQRDQLFMKKLLKRHPHFIQMVMKHNRMLTNGLDLESDKYDVDDCGCEGSDYLSEMAERVGKIKDKTYGRGQAKAVKRLLTYDEDYWYGQEYNCCGVTSVNQGVVIALEKLFRKYKGKKVGK